MSKKCSKAKTEYIELKCPICGCPHLVYKKRMEYVAKVTLVEKSKVTGEPVLPQLEKLLGGPTKEENLIRCELCKTVFNDVCNMLETRKLLP